MPLKLLFIVTLLIPLTTTAQELCSTDFNPVCGAIEIACFDDEPCPPLQRTYNNECYLHDAGATLLHEGGCSPSEECQDLPETLTCSGEVEIKLDENNCETLICHAGRTNSNAPTNCRMWFDGCNVCSRNVVAAELACSKKTCDQGKAARCIDFFPPEAINPPNCQRWFDGCNTCWRELPNANAECTEKFCDSQAEAYCLDYFKEVTTTKKPIAPRNCQRWFDGCNTCFRHTPEAPLACTLMACENNQKPRCLENFPKKIEKTKITKEMQKDKIKKQIKEKIKAMNDKEPSLWDKIWSGLKNILSWFWATN